MSEYDDRVHALTAEQLERLPANSPLRRWDELPDDHPFKSHPVMDQWLSSVGG